MMKQLFMSEAQSSLWPGISPCLLKPLMELVCFLKAKTSSFEAEIMKRLEGRFSFLRNYLTSMSECHDGILLIFSFIPDFQILR
jgi:hypothetical protein